jgi:agmatine/peptidylarginine deiminase
MCLCISSSSLLFAAGSYEVCEAEGLPYVSTDFVLEGGSIHVDGEG